MWSMKEKDDEVIKQEEDARRKAWRERPPRVHLTEEEVIKRMKEFYKRKEQILAAARACRI
jgi:hypothetical protein